MTALLTGIVVVLVVCHTPKAIINIYECYQVTNKSGVESENIIVDEKSFSKDDKWHMSIVQRKVEQKIFFFIHELHNYKNNCNANICVDDSVRRAEIQASVGETDHQDLPPPALRLLRCQHHHLLLQGTTSNSLPSSCIFGRTSSSAQCWLTNAVCPDVQPTKVNLEIQFPR